MSVLFAGPIQLLNTHIGAIYSHAGLDAALSFLLHLFQSGAPVHRIQCSAYDVNLNQLQSVAQVPPAPASSKGLDRREMIRNNRALYSAPNGDRISLLSRGEGSNAVAVALRKHTAEAQSLLVVPLFEKDKLACSFYLASDEDQVFDRSFGHFAYAITRKLGQLLQQNVERTGQFTIEYPPASRSSLDMLRMCPDMHDLICLTSHLARTDSTILIHGETGTGKEVLASAIHSLSERREGPFVTVNCGSIPDSLLESELFGHEKGAFTGAESSRAGYFEQAQNGTILLDEIGELPLHAQVHLLRTLERKEIQRVGGVRRIAVNTRVLAASHRDLQAMVREGKFREDLWYRLNVFPLSIPPLRERHDDINTLVPYFMGIIANKLGLKDVPQLTPEELSRLHAYPWPGNVRELEHALERALLYASATHSPRNFDFLSQQHAPINPLRETEPEYAESTAHAGFQAVSQEMLDLLRSSHPNDALPSLEKLGDAYLQALMVCGHNTLHGQNGLAEILQIHVNTLRPRLARLGMYVIGKRGRRKREE